MHTKDCVCYTYSLSTQYSDVNAFQLTVTYLGARQAFLFLLFCPGCW